MPGNHKPRGYTSISPYLNVPSADQTIASLKAVFGAVELRRVENETGGVRHAEVRIDDSVVMLADALPDWPPAAAQVHVYVPDVDAAYARALAAGATSLHEPQKRTDADKRGGVKDGSGTSWWISTQVDDEG